MSSTSDDLDELDPVELPLRFGELHLGSLVETRIKGLSSYGVIVERIASAPPTSRLVHVDGLIEVVKDSDVTYVLPDIGKPGLVKQCAGDEPDREAMHSIVQILRRVMMQLDQDVKKLVSRGTSSLYAKLVNNGETSVTTARALQIVNPASKQTDRELFAMHSILVDDYLHFLVDPSSHRSSALFDVRSPTDLRVLETVRDWVRSQASEIGEFAKRAAKILKWSRDHAPVAATSSTLEKHELPEAFLWSAQDLTIIEFLRKSLDRQRLIQPQPYLTVAPTILKAVEEEAKLPLTGSATTLEAGRDRMIAFLGEIGVVAPWEDWPVHELQDTFAEWEDQDARLAKSRSATQVTDEHDAVRQDFTKLPVYTIDDLGASELDDGISIEPAQESTWWVHVHVADPTAIVTPEHPLARLARQRLQTEYLPERSFAMLPHSLIQDYNLSLGSAEGTQNVLTISMRVDEHGDVHESKVSAGAISKVKRLTYDAVDKLLGHAPPPPRQFMRIGAELSHGSASRQTDDATLSNDATATKDLKQLHTIARALLRKRVASTAIAWDFPTGAVSVSPRLTHHFETSAMPTLYKTAPTLTFSLPGSGQGFDMSPAQVLVSECMIAANRAAARFALENDVPLAYRSQEGPVTDSAAVEKVLGMRDPATGTVNAFDVLRYDINFSPGKAQLSPGPHWPMGIHDNFGYTRVTSPLRRYSDLFAHWQLKSALLPSSSRKKRTPFSRDETAAEMQGVELDMARRGKLDRSSNDFWRTYFLSRKLQAVAGRAPDYALHNDLELAAHLFYNLTAVALRPASFSINEGYWAQATFIKELGVRAQLRMDDEGEALEKGEERNVKIDEILLSGRSRIVTSRR